MMDLVTARTADGSDRRRFQFLVDAEGDVPVGAQIQILDIWGPGWESRVEFVDADGFVLTCDVTEDVWTLDGSEA